MPDQKPPSQNALPPLAENLQSVAPPPLAEHLPNVETRKVPVRAANQPPVAPVKRHRATIEQEEAAEKHLREANVFKVRDDLKSAIAALEKASAANPYDPAPHILRGDMLRNVGRPDDALLAYEAAKVLTQTGAQQASVEGKIARLVVETAQVNDPAMSDERSAVASGGWVAVIASAFIPGLGQLAVGEIVKGSIVIAVWTISLLISLKIGLHRGASLMSAPVVLSVVVSTAAWAYSVADSIALKNRAERESPAAPAPRK